jgi:hypothetical protein
LTRLSKEAFGALAIVVTLFAFLPYIRSIRLGRTRPHLFSWLIWGLMTTIMFFAQLDAKGGAGAWPTGIAAALTFYIAVLAFRFRADLSITRIDWVFLLAALASLPIWYFNQDPMWSVVLLTTMDTLAFGPTLRQAYRHPEREYPLFFILFIVRNLLSLAALESYSVTTVLFPAVISLTCLIMVCILYWRVRVRG